MEPLLRPLLVLPPPPQLWVPLPPFDGAMRSSSLSIWKRFRGSGASGAVRRAGLDDSCFDFTAILRWSSGHAAAAPPAEGGRNRHRRSNARFRRLSG
jgi:hypothetical protein